MPWVWSDDIAARLVDAGLVDPEEALMPSHPPVAISVDDPEDLAVIGRRLFDAGGDAP